MNRCAQSVLVQFDNPRFSASTSGWWPPLKKTPSSHGDLQLLVHAIAVCVCVESTGVAEICGLITVYIADTWNQKPWCPSSPVWGGWFLIWCRLSQGHHTCRKLPLYISNTHGSWIFKSTQSIYHVKLQWFETASKVALLQGYRRVKSGFQGCMIC